MDPKALFKIGYGLYALITRDGEKENACIINSVMQVTSDPVQLVVGVNKSNYSHDLVMKTGVMNIATLTEDAPFSLFQDFGFCSGHDVENKLEGYAPIYSANGLRYLVDYANAYLSCKVTETKDMGTHTLFTVEVVDAEVLNEHESLTYAYYHKHTKPQPAAPAAAAEGKVVWVCRICGYVYEGEELPEDYVCPLCKHGPEDFEKIG